MQRSLLFFAALLLSVVLVSNADAQLEFRLGAGPGLFVSIDSYFENPTDSTFLITKGVHESIGASASAELLYQIGSYIQFGLALNASYFQSTHSVFVGKENTGRPAQAIEEARFVRHSKKNNANLDLLLSYRIPFDLELGSFEFSPLLGAGVQLYQNSDVGNLPLVVSFGLQFAHKDLLDGKLFFEAIGSIYNVDDTNQLNSVSGFVSVKTKFGYRF